MCKKIITLILSVLCLCFLLSGCGSQKEQAGDSESQLVQITDSAGNKVKLPKKPQRIVSLSLGTDEILMDLVEPKRIAALTYLSDDAGISHIASRSKKVNNKLRGNNAEAIMALKPDLVLIADWWKLETLQSLRDVGITVYVYKTPYTVADVKKTIMEVAKAVGEPEKGKQVINGFERKVNGVQKKIAKANLSQRKLMALTGKGAFGYKGSIYDDMCTYAKIDNCLKNIKTDENTTVSKEIIIESNPDVIITPSWNAPGMLDTKGVDELLSDESLKTVSAVKNKNVVSISGKTVYCVSQYVADGIEELAKAVYPEAF